jgi:hypothetical protein
MCFHEKIMGALGYKNSREQSLDVIVLTYRTHLAISDSVRNDGTYDGKARDLRSKLGQYVVAFNRGPDHAGALRQFADFAREERFPELPPAIERSLRTISAAQMKATKTLQAGLEDEELKRFLDLTTAISLNAQKKAYTGEYDLAALEEELSALESVYFRYERLLNY